MTSTNLKALPDYSQTVVAEPILTQTQGEKQIMKVLLDECVRVPPWLMADRGTLGDAQAL
jgi:hypothetical protein